MIGEHISVDHFQIEIGAMDYGLEIDGIIGFDFMREVGLIVDTKQLVAYHSNNL